MNTTPLAPPSPDAEVTLPTSSSEPQTSSQPQEPRTETPDGPDTRLSSPEEVAAEEPAGIVNEHDQAASIESTDDVQPETPPAADATTETSDDTADAEDSPTAQPVDGAADLTPACDEPDVEAADIAVAADDLAQATDNDRAEDSIPDSSALQAGHGTENDQEQIPSAAEVAIQPLSDIFNSSGAQHHAEAEESPSHLQSELLANISATIEDQTDKLTRLSSALFAMDKRFTELSTSVTLLSQELQKVSEETEQTVSWTESVAITSSLSRWFLALSIFMLIALLGGMGYLAVNQYQLMQQQSNASQAAATATELQIKRMAEFDTHFAELVGGAIKNERETIGKESVASKINKLRGGAPERRILRKSSGDWLIPNGKTEELVTDPEIIEALNLAFEKSGRPLITPRSLPPHKTVCILKPNGKGGTEVMITRETTP